jgi:hypothetical protein
MEAQCCKNNDSVGSSLKALPNWLIWIFYRGIMMQLSHIIPMADGALTAQLQRRDMFISYGTGQNPEASADL